MGLNGQLSQVQKYSDKYGDDAVINVIYESMGNNYAGITWDKIGQKVILKRKDSITGNPFFDMAFAEEGEKGYDKTRNCNVDGNY